MRLSVALCTYQGQAHLQEQLNSIARQSRPPDQLVACDDGSTDATVQILQSFASGAGFPVEVSVNEHPRGPLKNFEKATRLCDGDLIFFADQDDVWHHDKLEKLSRALAEDPSAGLVFSNIEIVSERLTPAGYTLWQFRRFTPRRQRRAQAHGPFRYILGQGIASGMAMGFRAEFKDLVLPFEGLGHDLWVSTLISAVADAVVVDECLGKWRQHSTQHTGAVTPASLKRRITESREHDSAHYAELVEGYSALLRRLVARQDTYPCGEDRLRALHEKIDHLAGRSRLREQKHRTALIALEVLRGRYRDYSYGMRSVAKDLLL